MCVCARVFRAIIVKRYLVHFLLLRNILEGQVAYLFGLFIAMGTWREAINLQVTWEEVRNCTFWKGIIDVIVNAWGDVNRQRWCQDHCGDTGSLQGTHRTRAPWKRQGYGQWTRVCKGSGSLLERTLVFGQNQTVRRMWLCDYGVHTLRHAGHGGGGNKEFATTIFKELTNLPPWGSKAQL